MKKHRVLILGASGENRRALCAVLANEYSTVQAESSKDALTALQHDKRGFAAVLLDLTASKPDGYAFLAEKQRRCLCPTTPVLVGIGPNCEETELHARSLGSYDCVKMPYCDSAVRHRLSNAIRLCRACGEIRSVERDELTGLYKKEFFFRLAGELLHANPDKRYDLVCVDIEKFKLVNDLFGTAEGDRVLRFWGAEMAASAGGDGFCGRIEGDKFAMLLPHREGFRQEWFEDASERVNRAPLKINLVLRAGIYVIEDPSVPVDVMCDRARLAIDSIKGKYGVYSAYYDPSIRERLLEEQRITDEMKPALAGGQFQVYFQPKYNLHDGSIAGAEALVRWHHPERGVLPPMEFILLFERNGFITDLDFFVWEQTCRCMREWCDAGHAPLPISANLSRVDIYNPHLPQLLMNMMGDYGLSPGQLHLEITESAYTENPRQLISVTTELKKLGFTLEMDDFGTGYSSLNMLSELPIDRLKLDMRFLHGKEEREDSKNILRFIIDLAQKLGLPVVAEGIETKAQAEMLRGIGCTYGQGYYFSKPLPQKEFESLLCRAARAGREEGKNCADAAAHGPEHGAPASDHIILIADDRADDRAQLRALFRSDHRVVEAQNSAQALAYLRETGGEADLILLGLPEQDGTVLLRQAKSETALCHIPIVVISKSGQEGEARALALGAADFVRKPFLPEAITRRVTNIMMRYHLERTREALRSRAENDALTGLYNRVEFETRIAHFLETQEHPRGAFVMIDIDNFKQLNDVFGHQQGDEALRTVAQVLRSSFRAEDMMARMGGDEFAVFTPYFFAPGDLQLRADLLCQKLRRVYRNGDACVEVSCSIGICLLPEHGSNYSALYANADKALLFAKRLGKNRFCLFGDNLKLPTPVLTRNMDWLLDEASDGIFVCDAQTYALLYLNRAAARIAGRTKEECIGKRCYEMIWHKNEPCSQCQRSQAKPDCFVEHQTEEQKDGRFFLVKTKSLDWNGTPAVIQYVQDNTARERQVRAEHSRLKSHITAQRVLVDRLHQATRGLEALLDNGEEGVAVLSVAKDQQVSAIFFSDGLCRMMGGSQEQLMRKFTELGFGGVHPEDRARVEQLFLQAVRKREKLRDTCRVRDMCGVYRDITVSAGVVEDTNGQAICCVTCSENKKA